MHASVTDPLLTLHHIIRIGKLSSLETRLDAIKARQREIEARAQCIHGFTPDFSVAQKLLRVRYIRTDPNDVDSVAPDVPSPSRNLPTSCSTSTSSNKTESSLSELTSPPTSPEPCRQEPSRPKSGHKSTASGSTTSGSHSSTGLLARSRPFKDQGSRTTPTNAMGWHEAMTRTLCATHFYPQDCTPIFEEASMLAFNDRHAYLWRCAAKTIRDVITNCRARMKRIVMHHLETIVALRPEQSLKRVCIELLENDGFVHNGDKKFQSLVLARALAFMYWIEARSATKFSWSSYPRPSVVFCISVLLFCLRNPKSTETNRHGPELHDEAASIVDSNSSELDASLPYLWAYAQNNKERLVATLTNVDDANYTGAPSNGLLKTLNLKKHRIHTSAVANDTEEGIGSEAQDVFEEQDDPNDRNFKMKLKRTDYGY
ncbi:hypothetical protein SeMB42_g05749 [Synchytrium endobioticum]|uniref:Uncharacterized protein n=1 Tax=Synchytrium endobioticum TaxID=286115 RepID=A0A507CPM3_9FUNG|nr:hypothetical protein SeMB42_g05749 [Synchytrium endobioticum]